jgi:transposase
MDTLTKDEREARNATIRKQYAGGLSMQQLAEIYGMTRQGINRIVGRGAKGGPLESRRREARKDVLRLYRAKQSLKKISEMTNTSYPLVRSILEEAGEIKPGQAVPTSSQSRFSESLRRRIALAYLDGETTVDAGKRFGVSQQFCAKVVKEYGLNGRRGACPLDMRRMLRDSYENGMHGIETIARKNRLPLPVVEFVVSEEATAQDDHA